MMRLTISNAAIIAALALTLVSNKAAQAQTFMGSGGILCEKFVASASTPFSWNVSRDSRSG
jgi:hypothetical protein